MLAQYDLNVGKKIGLHDISWITVIKSWNRGFMTGTPLVCMPYAVC